MSDDWKNKLKSKGAGLNDFAKGLKNKFEQTEAHAFIGKASDDLKQLLDENGVPEKAQQLVKTVDGHLDTLSGQKLLLLVEERMVLQARYNDILASRLEEALKRIEQLESALKKAA